MFECDITHFNRPLPKQMPCVIIAYGTIVSLQGRWPPMSYIGWEVVQMYFSFQDLMAFGLLIIALLTFIFNNRK